MSNILKGNSAGWLFAIIIVAALLRIIFWSGFIGTDDVVYISMGSQLAKGVIPDVSYIGAIRLGMNLPIGFFVWLFGDSEASFVIWPMLAGLMEVVLVYWVAHVMFGQRTAIFAALLMACWPKNVHLSGIVLADTPLSFLITASFVFFYFAERTRLLRWYFLAGIAIGLVYWIKEVALIYVGVFFVFALVYRTWRKEWLLVVLGSIVAVSANMILVAFLYGDPLHTVTAVKGSLATNYEVATIYEDSPFFYFFQFFLNVKHNWFLPLVGLLSGIMLLHPRFKEQVPRRPLLFVGIWGFGLLVLFSFLPISLQPVKFIGKQINYMTIFAAPFAIVGGVGLSLLGRKAITGALLILVSGSVGMAGLQQVSKRTFTGNTRAAVDWMATRAQPDTPVYGTANLQNGLTYYKLLIPSLEPFTVSSIARLPRARDEDDCSEIEERNGTNLTEVLVVIDPETARQGRNTYDVSVGRCWDAKQELRPDNSGAGFLILRAALLGASVTPGPIRHQIESVLEPFSTPKTATIYQARIALDDAD